MTDDIEERLRAFANNPRTRPGTIGHIEALCGLCGDDRPVILEIFPAGTVYVLTTEAGRPELREALAESRPAGIALIVEERRRLSEIVVDLILAARHDGANEERSLSWMDRLRRWWDGG